MEREVLETAWDEVRLVHKTKNVKQQGLTTWLHERVYNIYLICNECVYIDESKTGTWRVERRDDLRSTPSVPT